MIVKLAFPKAGVGSNVGFAISAAAMMTMAVKTAAEPYLRVHFPDIFLFSVDF
jgi:hypothetical protein